MGVGSGITYLLAGLAGAGKGYVAGKKANEEFALKEEEATQKALQDKIANYSKGITGFDQATGQPTLAQGYAQPGENYFSASQRQARDAKKPYGYKTGDLFDTSPDGSYVPKPGAELPEGILKQVITPQEKANPILMSMVDEEFGEGASKGVKPSQIATIVSSIEGRRGQNERFGAGQEGIDERQRKRMDQQEKQFDVTKNIQVAAQIKNEVKSIRSLDESLKRMDEVASQAKAFNPSGAEYQKLRLQAAASSYDPTRLFGGKSKIVGDLTPEEKQRLAWYSGLATDSIVSMFESGGKQLTPTEKVELGNLAITPNDSSDQIFAKVTRLRAKLQKARDSSQEVIDMFAGTGYSPAEKKAPLSPVSPRGNNRTKEESMKKFGMKPYEVDALKNAPDAPADQKTLDAGGAGAKVRMRGSDGRLYDVEEKNIPEALRRGATRVK